VAKAPGANSGTIAAAKVSAAIPDRVSKGMSAAIVIIFLRRAWKIVAVNNIGVSAFRFSTIAKLNRLTRSIQIKIPRDWLMASMQSE
jgi:hypothetical protein